MPAERKTACFILSVINNNGLKSQISPDARGRRTIMIKFTETGLNESILKAIEKLGFENPTPIQEKVIPYLLSSKKDIIGLAQTGTGKTAAFGLPIIQQIDVSSNVVQALILSPTRELCIQISKEMELYASEDKKINILPVYGGANITNQMATLRKGCSIVVATPGRALDLIKRKSLKVENIQYLVLDEADEMLNMGFKEELDEILKNTPSEKQTLLFSATMPREVQRISDNYLNDPFEISAGEKNKGAENVSHEYYMGMARYRYEILKRLVDFNPNIYGIVFCRTRRETKEVADKLMADGYNADALHGDLSQAMRESVMQRFRSRHIQLLVATDVAARGLDVNDLTHVIHYNLPDEDDVYIHRSGRTGRAGKTGISISIVHTREANKIRILEKITGKKFEKKSIPNGEEICTKQLFNLIDKMENVEVDETRIEPFMAAISEKLEYLDREQMIKHFVSMEFNRFLSYYKNSSDLNRTASSDDRDRNDRGRGDRSRGRERDRDRDRGRGESRDRGVEREKFQKSDRGDISFTRFFINVGIRDNITVPKLIGLINDTTSTRNIEIGKIDLMRNFSFFEVDSTQTDTVLKSFTDATFDEKPMSVEISKPDPAKESGFEKRTKKKGDYSGEKKNYSRSNKKGGSYKKGDSYKKTGPRNKNGR